jgi:PKD repeat protein
MKKITLTFFLIANLFAFNASAQCLANATLTPTATAGEFTITDFSTGAVLPYSYFQSYVNSTVGTLTVPLQPGSTTGTVQYPADGTYSWGVTYSDLDSTTGSGGCTVAFWDSITVTGMGTTPIPCTASFNLMQDSVNQNQYWCWNTSLAPSPATTLTYLWTFGDGTSSTQAYPTHVYNGIGSYVLCLTVAGGGCTSTMCDTIVITVKASGTTLNVLPAGAGLSLSEKTILQSLDLFPNPSKGQVSLAINSASDAEVKIEIVNITGQSVYSRKEGLKSGANKFELNQTALDNGIYFLNVIDLHTGSLKTLRFVKQ